MMPNDYYFDQWESLYLCLEAEQDWSKAVEDFTKSLKLKSDNPPGLVRRGQAYERLGKPEKALEDFRAAMAIAPGFKEAEEGVKRLSKN